MKSNKVKKGKVGKEITAWAFMARSGNGEKYFVIEPNDSAEIYLKKPDAIDNPFDYQRIGMKWKPTKLKIKIT